MSCRWASPLFCDPDNWLASTREECPWPYSALARSLKKNKLHAHMLLGSDGRQWHAITPPPEETVEYSLVWGFIPVKVQVGLVDISMEL